MSQVQVNCPFCQKALVVESQYLGSQLTCPSCGGTFFVPAQTQAPQQPQNQQPGFQQAPPPQYQQPGFQQAPPPQYQQPGFQQAPPPQYQQPQYQQPGMPSYEYGSAEEVNMFTALKKYAQFSGRARRKEYWLFWLLNFLINAMFNVLNFICLASDAEEIGLVFSIFSWIWSLAVLIPNLAVLARRLHDTGRSGWCMLLNLIPCVGWIIVLVMTLQDSQPCNNQYGPNPKNVVVNW